MTEEQMLIYAAKAIGCSDISTLDPNWYPIENKGQAFSLAVTLGLFGRTDLTYQFMEATTDEQTMLVIVRAAAEIGKII